VLDAGTGEPLWRVAADHWIPSSPAVTSDLVSFGSEGGLLYPLNVVTAELDWRFDEAEAIFSNPVIANDVLFGSGWRRRVLRSHGRTVTCGHPCQLVNYRGISDHDGPV
jgi:outer membrane protein assembly factor BamB